MTQEQLLNDGKAIIRGSWLGAKVNNNKGEKEDEKTHQKKQWIIQGISHTLWIGKEAVLVEERAPRGTVLSQEDLEKHAARFKRDELLVVELSNLRRGDFKEGGMQLTTAVWNGLHRANQSPAGRV
jgi:hypothetical protein